MGSQYSKQEAAFVDRRFDDLIELAVSESAESQNIGEPRKSSSSSSSSGGFSLSLLECEGIIALCDETNNRAIINSSCAIHAFQEQHPSDVDDSHSGKSAFITCMIHYLAAVAGEDWEVASARWNAAATSAKENCREERGFAAASFTPTDLVTVAVRGMAASFQLQNMSQLQEVDKVAGTIRSICQRLASYSDDIEGKRVLPVVYFFLNWLIASIQEQYVGTLLRLQSGDREEVYCGIEGCTEFARSALGVFQIQNTSSSASSSVPQPHLTIHCFKKMMKRLTSLVVRADTCFLDAPMSVKRHHDGREQQLSSAIGWETVASTFVGQRHAIAAVQSHLQNREVGLGHSNKPNVFLLFGPSGHGKTEFAKTIAKVMHHTENPEKEGKLQVFHLPSMCTKESIYSLVDPPAAHVGEGVLLSAVRNHSDVCVVLDEFEKGAAEAVQNLWLSAFQRDGMLRSLKDASRSASTANVTFVLTCNLCDDLMDRDKPKYLNASESQQEVLRRNYTEQCRHILAEHFGDPFLNRIDLILPFTPYSFQERCDFASIEINSLAKAQLSHGRALFPGHSLIRFIANNMSNFHSTSQCAKLLSKDITALVEKAKADVENSAVEKANGMWVPPWIVFSAVPLLGEDALSVIALTKYDSMHQQQAFLTEANQAMSSKVLSILKPPAKKKAAVSSPLEAAEAAKKDNTVSPSVLQSGAQAASKAEVETNVQQNIQQQTSGGAATQHTQGPQSILEKKGQRSQGNKNIEKETKRQDAVRELETEKECEVNLVNEMEKGMITDLQKELKLTKDKLLEKEKEVDYYKSYALHLEKALGYALLTVMALSCFLLFFIEVQTLLLLLLALVAVLMYFPTVLQLVGKALYAVLGPRGCIAAGVILLGVVVARAQHIVRSCPQ